jgi:hypothetical protein
LNEFFHKYSCRSGQKVTFWTWMTKHSRDKGAQSTYFAYSITPWDTMSASQEKIHGCDWYNLKAYKQGRQTVYLFKTLNVNYLKARCLDPFWHRLMILCCVRHAQQAFEYGWVSCFAWEMYKHFCLLNGWRSTHQRLLTWMGMYFVLNYNVNPP